MKKTMTVEEAIKYIDEYLFCHFECDPYTDCIDCGMFSTNADLKKVLQMLKEILEKQIPKKVKFMDSVFLGKPCKYPYCPTCGGNFNGSEWWDLKCCPDCGQKLDWSEEE